MRGRSGLRISWPQVVEYRTVAAQAGFRLRPDAVQPANVSEDASAERVEMAGVAGKTIELSPDDILRDKAARVRCAAEIANLLTWADNATQGDSRAELRGTGRCSLFVQIGDINVHRLALVLDEVFGPDNRVATITWRPTGGSSARTLLESASYLLWYAKGKSSFRYHQPYQPLDKAGVVQQFSSYARIEEADGEVRHLTKPERAEPNAAISDESALFKRENLTSMGSSTTGRTREIIYRDERYHCGDGRHWRAHGGFASVPRFRAMRAVLARMERSA